MMMDLNWKAPFEFAFELGLFLVGSILVLAVVFFSALVIYGLVKGFFLLLLGLVNQKKKQQSQNLKPLTKDGVTCLVVVLAPDDRRGHRSLLLRS